MSATKIDFSSVNPLFRRAGGRRSLNARRQARASARLLAVARLLGRFGWRHGVQAKIARELRCHRSTICRDLQTLNLMSLHGYTVEQLRMIPQRDRTLQHLVYGPRERRP